MKKKFTFLLAALVLLGGLVGPMGKAKGQSITFTNLTNPQPTLSFSYGVGNEAPEGQYAYVSCANLGDGNTVTVSLGQGTNSHFELWVSESSQSEWNNLTQFTVTTTDPYWFGFGFLVRLKPGYQQDSEHSDVVNLTATVNGSPVSASITLTGTVTATTYNIEFDYGLNPHGWVAVYPSHDVVAGGAVSMDVHPVSGYRFQSFAFYKKSNHEEVNSEDISFFDLSSYPYADHQYEFLMPAYDLLIEASFVPNSNLPTPTIMVGTTPMTLSYGYGDPDPEGNFMWFGVQNPGNNSAIWAEVNSTDFELCQVTDPDAITWNGQYVGVQSTDANYFGFTLGIRLKPGLERGTYSSVLTLGAERATDVVINLTGTVTDPTYHITILEETGGYAVCYQGYDHTAGTEVTLATQLSSGYVGTGVWTVFKEEDGEWVADNSVEINNNRFIMPAYDIKIQPHFSLTTEPCIVVGDYYITLAQSVADGFRLTGATCYNFTPQGGITVKQYTDATCQEEQTDRWLTITTTSNGNNGYNLFTSFETINTSSENRTTYARIEGVTADNQNVYSAPIEITQLGKVSISFGENNQLELASGAQSGTIPLVCSNLSGVDHWKVKTPEGGCELKSDWITFNFVETSDGYEIHYTCEANPLAIIRSINFSVWAYDANGNVMGASENWLDGDYMSIYQNPETLISTTRDVYSFDATGATQVYTCPPEGSSFTVVSNQTGSFDYNEIPYNASENYYLELQLSGYVDHAIKGIKLDMMPGAYAWGTVQVYVGDLNEPIYYDLAHINNGAFRSSWPNKTYSEECYHDIDIQMNGDDANHVIGSGEVLKIRITSTAGTLYCQGVTVDYVGAPSYVTEKWYETDLEDILPGDEFVIAGYYVFHWYGMDNTNGKAIPLHLSPSNESVLLGIESGSSADFNSVKWTFDRYQGKYLFKPVGTTGQYLKCSTSGDVTIGTGPDNRGFEWSPRPMFNDHYYLNCNGYYLVIDENGDYYNHYWKGFDANHTPGRQTKFFKKTYEYLYDNIATARYQASQANPLVLNVRGVVSHKSGAYLYLQNADVAIMLRRNDFVNGDDYDQIVKGDEIIVRGRPYRDGYVLAMHNLSLIQVKSQGNTVTPIEVTISELAGDNGSDPWNTKEFMLVKVKNAVVDYVNSNTKFTISQETVQASVSHHTNVEVAQFNEVDVIGVFRRTSNGPELVPRSVNDITVYRPHNVIYGPVIQNESTPDAQYLPVVTLNTESNYSGAYMQNDRINLSFPTSLTTGANDEIFYQYSGVGVYTLDEQNQRTYLTAEGGDASDNRSWIEFNMPNEDVHVEVYYARWYPLRYYKYMNENGTVRLKASMLDGSYPHSGPLYDMPMAAPEGYSFVGWSRGTDNRCGDYVEYGVYETGATMLNSDDIWYWPLFQKAGEEELYTMVFVGEQTYGGSSNLQVGGPMLVESGAVLDMGNLSIQDEGNSDLFIIDDGGQVICNNPFKGTMRKNITGYGTEDGNWYLLSNPINDQSNVYATSSPIRNLIDANGEYDLYSFSQSEDEEWRNFKDESHDHRWKRGQGVLYANKHDVTVEFKDRLNNPTNGYNVQYDESASFKGFNLVGNPWTYDAYINQAYYRMNPQGTELMEASASQPIHPCEGIFVQVAEAGRISFTREQPRESGINVNASNNEGMLIDRATVRFGEGNTLAKFQLNANSTKLSIPQGDKEFAVVRSAAQGEMPLNFKAEKGGTYTLSFDVENVEMDYLHLIDNMTGADVDLLAGASTGSATYTFTAKTTDYASRFRLVFRIHPENEDDM